MRKEIFFNKKKNNKAQTAPNCYRNHYYKFKIKGYIPKSTIVKSCLLWI